MANCGLLGQITYADNSNGLYQTAYGGGGGGVADQTQYYSHDATKVSYNSVAQAAQPLLANPSPVYHQQSLQYQVPQQQQQQQQLSQYQYQQQLQQLPQYQQQVNYQPTGYAQYQSNLIQQSAAAPQYVQQQTYSSAPFVQNVQYSAPQQQYYSNAADVSYNYVTVPATATGYSQNLNYKTNQNGNQQQYFNVQQTAPVQVQQYQQYQQQQQYQQPQQQQQQYQLVQPLQQTVVNVPQKPAQKLVQKPIVTLDYLPATTPLPATVTVTKNAHHYPAPAHVLHKQQQQQQQIGYVNPTVWNHQIQTAPLQQHQHSQKAPQTVFRTSFSGLQGQQQIVVAPSNVNVQQQSQRVIESGPHFTHTVMIPTGAIQSPPQSRSSLQSNPVRVPSVGLVAPIVQQNSQNQQQQPQLQTPRAFSPSTAVSHTKFEGLGVRYEW